MRNYGDMIKKYCNKHNLTQKDFGKIVGIDRSRINKIVLNRVKPNGGDLPKLEKFFNELT